MGSLGEKKRAYAGSDHLGSQGNSKILLGKLSGENAFEPRQHQQRELITLIEEKNFLPTITNSELHRGY